jgi:hypothetical protein
MQLARRASLPMALYLLTSAATAPAQNAWVLWRRFIPADNPEDNDARLWQAGDAQAEQHGEARSGLGDGLDVVLVDQTPSVAVIVRPRSGGAVSVRMSVRVLLAGRDRVFAVVMMLSLDVGNVAVLAGMARANASSCVRSIQQPIPTTRIPVPTAR